MPEADSEKPKTQSARPPVPPVSDWDFRSITQLSQALQARKISASELLAHVIARIEALDERINAIVVHDFDRARDAARVADAALSRGDQRPLLGIPVTLRVCPGTVSRIT